MTLDQKLYILTILLGVIMTGIVYFVQNDKEKREKKALIKDVEDSRAELLATLISEGVLSENVVNTDEKQWRIFSAFLKSTAAFAKLKNVL